MSRLESVHGLKAVRVDLGYPFEGDRSHYSPPRPSPTGAALTISERRVLPILRGLTCSSPLGRRVAGTLSSLRSRPTVRTPYFQPENRPSARERQLNLEGATLPVRDFLGDGPRESIIVGTQHRDARLPTIGPIEQHSNRGRGDAPLVGQLGPSSVRAPRQVDDTNSYESLGVDDPREERAANGFRPHRRRSLRHSPNRFHLRSHTSWCPRLRRRDLDSGGRIGARRRPSRLHAQTVARASDSTDHKAPRTYRRR